MSPSLDLQRPPTPQNPDSPIPVNIQSNRMNGVHVPGSKGSTQGKGVKEAFWNVLGTLHPHPPNTHCQPPESDVPAPYFLRNVTVLTFPQVGSLSCPTACLRSHTPVGVTVAHGVMA